jgi:serine O-acetyltransferase
MQSFIDTLRLIRSDMQYRCDYEHKQLNALRVVAFLTNHAVVSQILYRWQVFFDTHHLSMLASLLKSINSLVFTVNIDSSARIGPSLLLLHANYIHIGKNVTIGTHCILAQQNAICPAYILSSKHEASEKGPTIGNHVLFGVGSTVTGNITIGHRCKISVNSAVDKSFPDSGILVGVPAKNLSIN